tara:strand:- start:273 stop:3533 length:3261 start_codon:yes stop_codon:yes gene_type:complete
MPLYEVEIAPGVYEDVEAANPEDARKIVKAQIAKGVLSPVYDDIFFDYDTGVDDLQLRRLLSRAERYDEKESVLRNFVGSSGYTRTTDGQLALTPKGLRDRGQPVQRRTLDDGTIVEINTVIDSSSPFERGDFADFMGVAGPVVGSVAGILPQSKIFKGVRALSGGNLTAQRILGSGVGGATGKLTEEAADYIQGFQLQDAQDIAGLAGAEFLLGAGGETLGALGGGLYRMYFGAKAPTSAKRLAFQAAKGRDILDIKKLDADLGKEATDAQIKKAVAEGKVKVLDEKYRISLEGLEINLAGKTQQIAESVLKSSREKSNIPYLKELFDNMTASLRGRGATLNAYVDDVTADTVSDTINQTKRNLEMQTIETAKITKEAVEDLANSYIGVEPYLDAPGLRDYGQQILKLLGDAKGEVNKQVGDMYDAVDETFFSVAKYDGNVPVNAPAKAIDDVIAFYKSKAKAEIDFFKLKHGITGKSTKILEDPNVDINVKNVLEAEAEINKLGEQLPRFEGRFEDKVPFGKLSRVLETKRKINALISSTSRESKERRLFLTLTRLLDDSDLHRLKGEDFLKNNPDNADSIFTILSLKGNELIELKNALGKNLFDTLSIDDIKKVNESINLLRAADKLNAKLNEPFDNAIIKKITNAARGSGAFDPDEVFEKLVSNGSLRQLDDFFKAVDDYDQYLIASNKPELATNLNRVKTQTAQRLFANAFEESVDPVTDNIDFTVFAKNILKFESKHPGKIDSLFRGADGTTVGPTIKQTIKQLQKIAPKLKANDIDDLIAVFRGQDGLNTTAKGTAFINALEQQAKASAEQADLLANRNLSELPNRSPSEIVETIFRPKNSANIIKLRQLMGEENFAAVREASLGQLLEDAIDYNVKTGNVTDIFKVKNLNTALDKYSDETLEAMFGKEFTTDIKNFADTIDVLTKGEIGRGNFPGALVAAGIAAGIVFAPLAAIPTIAGLQIAKTMLGSPGFIKFASRTDKGSIIKAFETLRTAAAQFGYRYIDGELREVREQTSLIIDENVPDIDIDEILGINQQISPPQVNISLPQVTPVRVSDPLRQEQQDRIEFAERLFRRPII